MAKPRVFVSSTYYDLRHIRQGIETFINDLGYEPVLFERGHIPYVHDDPLESSCYREIATCNIFVLIIGGQYGSASAETPRDKTKDAMEKHYENYNSITEKEFDAAQKKNIPCFIFVEQGVAAEYRTYKENRDKTDIRYAHVDSVNVFRLLDAIYQLDKNNQIHAFDHLDDVTTWLRAQWAGLFAEFLREKTTEQSLNTMSMQLENLSSVTGVLKEYTEKLLRGPLDDPDKFVEELDQKLQLKRAKTAIEHGALKHLVDSHDVHLDHIVSAIRDANDAIELRRNLENLASCGVISSLPDVFLVATANQVRRELSLKMISVPPQPSKTKDTPPVTSTETDDNGESSAEQ